MSEITRESWKITSTAEWLDRRRADVTASRLPALFGLNPYLSREQLADIMRGTVGTGTGSVPDSPAMRRGRILEPAVAAALAEERPDLPPLVKATTYHRVPEWRLGCTPDYWCGDEGLVQCKTVSPQQWQAWHGKIPTGYLIQTLCEMMVTGRAWGLLACLEVSPSYPLHIAAVPRHEKAERSILNAVANWWRAFDAGEIAGTAPSAELEAALDDGSFVDLSADNALPSILDERAAAEGDNQRCRAAAERTRLRNQKPDGPRIACVVARVEYLVRHPTQARNHHRRARHPRAPRACHRGTGGNNRCHRMKW